MWCCEDGWASGCLPKVPHWLFSFSSTGADVFFVVALAYISLVGVHTFVGEDVKVTKEEAELWQRRKEIVVWAVRRTGHRQSALDHTYFLLVCLVLRCLFSF